MTATIGAQTLAETVILLEVGVFARRLDRSVGFLFEVNVLLKFQRAKGVDPCATKESDSKLWTDEKQQG